MPTWSVNVNVIEVPSGEVARRTGIRTSLRYYEEAGMRMRDALELGLKCGCVRIEDCSLSPTDALSNHQTSAKGCSC